MNEPSHFGKWRRRISETGELHAHVPHHAEIKSRHLAVRLAEVVEVLVAFAAAQDWWTPEGSQRIHSRDCYVKEIEATTSVIQ